MTVVPGGFANVQIAGTTPGNREWLIACACQIEDWDPDNLDDIDTYLVGEDYVSNYLAEDYVITTVRVIVGTSDPHGPIVFTKLINVEGGAGTGAGPGVCYLVTKTTNLGGRHGRGRTYFPGVQIVGQDDAGNLVGDIVGDPSPLTTFWTDLFTQLELGDAYLLHTDPDEDPTAIIGWSLSPMVATQRRRLRG